MAGYSKNKPIINIEGPANIFASNESLFSIGANLISRSIPLNNKKTKEEPTKRPITTSKFLEISSVSSLNKMAWERNHTRGKAPSAKKEIPKLNSLSCCDLFFIFSLHKL